MNMTPRIYGNLFVGIPGPFTKSKKMEMGRKWKAVLFCLAQLLHESVWNMRCLQDDGFSLQAIGSCSTEKVSVREQGKSVCDGEGWRGQQNWKVMFVVREDIRYIQGKQLLNMQGCPRWCHWNIVHPWKQTAGTWKCPLQKRRNIDPNHQFLGFQSFVLRVCVSVIVFFNYLGVWMCDNLWPHCHSPIDGHETETLHPFFWTRTYKSQKKLTAAFRWFPLWVQRPLNKWSFGKKHGFSMF